MQRLTAHVGCTAWNCSSLALLLFGGSHAEFLHARLHLH